MFIIVDILHADTRGVGEATEEASLKPSFIPFCVRVSFEACGSPVVHIYCRAWWFLVPRRLAANTATRGKKNTQEPRSPFATTCCPDKTPRYLVMSGREVNTWVGCLSQVRQADDECSPPKKTFFHHVDVLRGSCAPHTQPGGHKKKSNDLVHFGHQPRCPGDTARSKQHETRIRAENSRVNCLPR